MKKTENPKWNCNVILIAYIIGTFWDVENVQITRDLYSLQAPIREITPHQALRNYSQNNPKNFGMFQRCIKWRKFWKMGEKRGN